MYFSTEFRLLKTFAADFSMLACMSRDKIVQHRGGVGFGRFRDGVERTDGFTEFFFL